MLSICEKYKVEKKQEKRLKCVWAWHWGVNGCVMVVYRKKSCTKLKMFFKS